MELRDMQNGPVLLRNERMRPRGEQGAATLEGARPVMERREKQRARVDTPLLISVDGQQLKTQMLDMSEHGTLLRIDASCRDRVTTQDLGKDASFVVRVKGGASRKYTGEIIRFFVKGQDKYIAVRFWEGYQELAT